MRGGTQTAETCGSRGLKFSTRCLQSQFVEKVFGFLAAASLSGGLLVFSGLQQTSALPAETSSNAADAKSSSERFVSSGSTLSKIDEAKLESFSG